MDHNASSGFHPVNQYLDIFHESIMSEEARAVLGTKEAILFLFVARHIQEKSKAQGIWKFHIFNFPQNFSRVQKNFWQNQIIWFLK